MNSGRAMLELLHALRNFKTYDMGTYGYLDAEQKIAHAVEAMIEAKLHAAAQAAMTATTDSTP